MLRMLQWDTLGVKREQHTAIIMHKILQNKAPDYLTDGTAYNLRDSGYNLALPKPRTEKIVFHIVGLNCGIFFQIRSNQTILSSHSESVYGHSVSRIPCNTLTLYLINEIYFITNNI